MLFLISLIFIFTIVSVSSVFVNVISDINAVPSDSVITIINGTYSDTHFEINNKKNITIDTNGTVIIQQCDNPMIIKNSDNITISNIIIRNCSSLGLGGGLNITNSYYSTFRNVSFLSNSAESGGGMGIVDSEVYINAGIFTGNYATQFGGGIISIRSSLFVAEDSLISENMVGTSSIVGNGGGIFVSSPIAFTVKNSHILLNNASHLGGGIYISPASLDFGKQVDIIDTNFEHNQVSRKFVCNNCGPLSGGAAIYGRNVSMNIDGCFFLGNDAYIALSSVQVIGGGILALGSKYDVDTTVDHYRPTLTVTRSIFEQNMVASVGIGSAGGAVFAGDALLEVHDCYFHENSASSVANQSPSPTTGGAICYESGSSFTMSNTTLHTNVVNDGTGGAVYIANSRSSKQINVTYINNRVVSGLLLSSKGGALFAVSGEDVLDTIDLHNCTFINNTAEPLLERDVGAISGLRSTYGGFAGALYMQSIATILFNCHFERNVAYNGNFAMLTGGGAIVLNTVTGCKISDSSFSNNYALGSIHFNELYSMPGIGGAILSLSSSCNIDTTTFDLNLASATGSVISDYNSVQPSASGGAIAVIGSSFVRASGSINNCIFTNNFVVGNLCFLTSSIPSGSAAAVLSMESEINLRIVNSSFLSNVAVSGLAEQLDLPPIPAWGGAIAYSRSPIEITDSHFKHNLLYGIGYGIDLAGLPVTTGSTRSEINVHNTQFERGDASIDKSNELLVQNVTLSVCRLAQEMQKTAPDRVSDAPVRRRMINVNLNSEAHSSSSSSSSSSNFDNIDSLDHLSPLLREHHLKRNLLHDAGDREMKKYESRVLSALHYGHEKGRTYETNTSDTHQQLMHSLHLLRRGRSPLDSMPTSNSEGMKTSSSSDDSSTDNMNNKKRRLQARSLDNPFSALLSVIARNLGVAVTDLQLLLSSSVSVSGSNIYGSKFTYMGPLNFFIGDEQEFMNVWLGRPVGNDAEGTTASFKFGYVNYTRQHSRESSVPMVNDTVFISAISSTVTLDVDFPTISLVELTSILAIDATFIMESSNVYIDNVAALAQAAISGTPNGSVYQTIDIGNATISNRGISRLEPSLNIENCTLEIRDSFSILSVGSVKLTNSFDFLSTLNVTDAATLTFYNATLHIKDGADLRLRTSLVLAPDLSNATLLPESESRSKFINDGHISIGGTYSIDTLFDDDQEPLLRPGEFEFWSRTTPLLVFVPFINNGNLDLYLGPADNSADENTQRQPALYMLSNQTFSGQVFVTATVSDQSVDGLTLYPPESPSIWYQMILFGEMTAYEECHVPSAEIISTTSTTVINGVTQAQDYIVPVRTELGFSEDFVLQNIACESINTLYADIPSDFSTGTGSQQAYACDICLRNSSCHICPSNCITIGQFCDDGNSGVSDCCGGCLNDGVCQSSGTPGETDFSFGCECTFLYTGATCNSYSDVFYVIAVLPPALLVGFVALWLIYRSRKNYKSLRKAMRDGILGKRSDVSKEHFGFFSALQQDLVLNELLVDYNELILEKKIGEGAFGVVYAARYMNERVALKKLRQPMYLSLSKEQVDAFKLEAYTMTRMRHPNIVLVMGIALTSPAVDEPAGKSGHIFSSLPRSSMSAFSEADPTLGQTVCILTEFLDQGSLADLLHGDHKLPESAWTYELALRCALQAARGMLYLHSRNPPMIHRDLKSANLVVNSHWVVKVTDFGMSRILPRKREVAASAFDSYNPFGFGTSSDDRLREKETKRQSKKKKRITVSLFASITEALSGAEQKPSESTEEDDLTAQEEEAMMNFDIRQTYSISGLGAPELAKERVRTVSFDEYATTVQGMQLENDHANSHYGVSALNSFSFSGWEGPEISHVSRRTISGDRNIRQGNSNTAFSSRSHSRSNSIGDAHNPLHSNISSASTVKAGAVAPYRKFGAPVHLNSTDAAGRGPTSDLKKKLLLHSQNNNLRASGIDDSTVDSDLESAREAQEAKDVSGTLNSSAFDLTARLGTPAWAAPELNASHVYGTKVDIFSFGMVMWELIHRKRPYDGYTSRFDIEDAIARGERPPVSPACPYRWKHLMERCWQGNPALRPPFKDIVTELEEMLAIEAPLENPSDPDGQNSRNMDSRDRTLMRSRAISITSPVVPTFKSFNGTENATPAWSHSNSIEEGDGEEQLALLSSLGSVVEESEVTAGNNNDKNKHRFKSKTNSNSSSMQTALEGSSINGSVHYESKTEVAIEGDDTFYSNRSTQSTKSVLSEFTERTHSMEERLRAAADDKINEDEHVL